MQRREGSCKRRYDMVGVVERDGIGFRIDMNEYLYSKRRRQPIRPKEDEIMRF